MAGCTIYQPLDQGSRVPWAQAQLAKRDGAALSQAGAQGAVVGLAQADGRKSPHSIRTRQGPRMPTHAARARPGPTPLAGRSSERQEVAGVRLTPSQPVPSAAAEVAPEPVRVAALEVGEIEPAAGSQPAPKAKPEKAVSRPREVAFGADSYTVGSGDTLSGIAQRLDVGMSELAKANGLSQPYRLHAGQKLRIPDGSAAETTTVKLGEDQGSVRLATGKPPPLDGDEFLWPVNGKVIGAFGPIDQWRRRDGIDIAARRGAPVLAAQDGIVAYAGDGIPGYGEMILIRHDQGYITTYAHNAVLLVAVGDVVRRGQVIARVGDTGAAEQPMLHFELRKGRQAIDPEARLVKGTTTLASGPEDTG